MPTALLVDDDMATLDALTALVERSGFSTTRASTLREARTKAGGTAPDLLLIDLQLPDGNGIELVDEMEKQSKTEVVLITGHASVDSAVAALRLGVTEYLTKPIEVDRLKLVLANVAKSRELKAEAQSLRSDARKVGSFGLLYGASTAMQSVYDLLAKAAPTNATIFLIGASGTGKELAAQTAHKLSRRCKGPFVPVNCSAISQGIMESELFGHIRGSFTGADHAHKGFFERATGGTLFLDEITEMNIDLQAKLLRVLETASLLRVGAEKEMAVDVRVIAATNRDPEQAVAAGKLREDLFYRLNVFPVRLPTLKEREGDVAVLAKHFLKVLNDEEQKKKTISPAALERLASHHWPGNVRELKNVIHRAFIIADDEIGPDCLPMHVPLPQENLGANIDCRVGHSIADVERRLMMATLEHFGGDKRKVAEVLGISVRTLYNRLEEYRRPQGAGPAEGGAASGAPSSGAAAALATG